MKPMTRLTAGLCLLTAGLTASSAWADTISISRMDPRDLKSTYFAISDGQKVEVEFLAPPNDDEEHIDFAWIIDLDSRETVWRSRKAPVQSSGKYDNLEVYGDTVRLNEGRYGLYFSTHHFHSQTIDGVDFFLYGLSALMKNSLNADDIEQMYVDLRGTDLKRIDDDHFAPFGKDKKALVELREVGKQEYKQYGLTVNKAAPISIYAMGEIAGRDLADYASIFDADSGELVWRMDRDESEAAGGSHKNRQFKGTVNLEKGHYVLGYSSDDSHHYRRWNAAPPYDPSAWGVSVYADKDAAITTFDPVARQAARRIVGITEVGDDAYLSKHFELDKETPLRVHAIGESYSRDRMADFGWIVNAESGETVWTMDASKTRHAGGARKNREIIAPLVLPKGKYSVYYESDDSHSFERWNAAVPNKPTAWGISLYATAKDFDKSQVKMIEPPQQDALAQIVRVGDSQNRKAVFSLSEDQKVRIYAIGEGDSSEMFDYAYIKRADNGRRVWHMFADETQHAGGADKNRQTDQIIELKAGEYEVYFQTDGSHSFNDWNATPPRDRGNYGVTVFDAGKRL